MSAAGEPIRAVTSAPQISNSESVPEPRRRGPRPKPPCLKNANLDRTLAQRGYKQNLSKLQDRLREINQAILRSDTATIVILEGWDAAGKGGVIRRISEAMDPRCLRVWPTNGPQEILNDRHYFRRFWNMLPANGEVALFETSWYSRLVAERVDGEGTAADWVRAYRKINSFEQMLLDDGITILKFFLHISEKEQMDRFRKRLLTPKKRWKVSKEDFHNSAKRDDYTQAVDEMLAETHLPGAPWNVIPAEDKRFARVRIMRALCDHLSEGLDLGPQAIDDELLDLAARRLRLSAAELSALSRRDTD